MLCSALKKKQQNVYSVHALKQHVEGETEQNNTRFAFVTHIFRKNSKNARR